jgi:hypothetical protein
MRQLPSPLRKMAHDPRYAHCLDISTIPPDGASGAPPQQQGKFMQKFTDAQDI